MDQSSNGRCTFASQTIAAIFLHEMLGILPVPLQSEVIKMVDDFSLVLNSNFDNNCELPHHTSRFEDHC